MIYQDFVDGIQWHECASLVRSFLATTSRNATQSGKQFSVAAKEGDKVRLVRFGDAEHGEQK